MPFNYSGMSLDESARITDMRQAWDAYNGRFTPPLSSRGRRRSVFVNLNRCAPIVDKGVSLLFGKNVDFQVGEDAANAPAAQAWLDASWKANRKMLTLHKMGVNGGVSGHVFTKLLETTLYPRLVVLDTTMLSVEHAPDDIEDISAYCIHYTADDLASGKQIEYRQRIERVSDAPGTLNDAWQITEQQRTKGGWQNGATTPWEWPFSPVRQCQNLPAPNQFWGMADLTPDIIQLNQMINFNASNIQQIIKYHAYPKTYATGMGGNKLVTAPDSTIILPEGATLANLEMQSDLSSSMAFLQTLQTSLDVSARIPAIALGDLQDIPRGTISGAAIELLYGVATEKTQSKRELYGELLEDICRCMLAMGGFDPMTPITIMWPDVLPSDKLATAQVAQIWLDMGISQQSVYEKLGFDYADEQSRLLAEAQDAAKLAAAKRLSAPDLDDPDPDDQTSSSPTEPDEGDDDTNDDTNGMHADNPMMAKVMA